MVLRILTFLLTLQLLGSIGLAQQTRSWTSVDGNHKTDAILIEVRDGKAHLQKRDGTVVFIQPSKLCDLDKAYIRKFIAANRPKKDEPDSSEPESLDAHNTGEPSIEIEIREPGPDISIAPRFWTIGGEHVEAVFVTESEGKVTLLRSDTSEQLQVPLEQLPNAERALIASHSLMPELPLASKENNKILAQVTGRVTNVLDGDTITVSAGREQINLRLRGIDAPERKQAFGEQSRAALAQALLGQIVAIDIYGLDQHGRHLGVVFHDSENVNLSFVRAGWAWYFREYCEDAVIAAAQVQAKENRRGLWAAPRPVAPWKYRQRN